METILERNSAKTQEPICMAPLAAGTLTEEEAGPEIMESNVPEDQSNSSISRRGFGSAAHAELRGETYHLWASEVLLELCRTR